MSAKPTLGLSISTTAASSANPLGAASSQPTGGSLFANWGSGATSKPAQQAGLFGSAPSSQATQSGGLFGSTASQPNQSGGLFASAPSQSGGLSGAINAPSAGSGLFASASSNPPQSGGTLGSTTSQSTLGGGLFGAANPQPTSGTGLFGLSSQASQGGGLPGTASTQAAPAGGLFGAAFTSASQGGLGGQTSQPNQGLFGGPGSTGASKPVGSLNLGQQPTYSASTSGTRIDLDHLRPTTKFDQLTEDLQKEILGLDTAILNEIGRCNEVSNLLPAITAAGANIPNDVAYISEKLEEVELGLENDAEDIQNLKEKTVKKDAREAKVCFREVDRLKMPSQYQTSITDPTMSVSSGVYGGHGLSGWWNHPQTLQRTVRGGAGGGGIRALQLPGDEEEGLSGPASLIDFFERRTEEMRNALAENKSLLTQVEEFVTTVEGKITMKQREVMGHEEGGLGGVQDEDELGLLRYVFGEFERSLYEVADKVGAARDGVQELVLGSPGYQGRL